MLKIISILVKQQNGVSQKIVLSISIFIVCDVVQLYIRLSGRLSRVTSIAIYLKFCNYNFVMFRIMKQSQTFRFLVCVNAVLQISSFITSYSLKPTFSARYLLDRTLSKLRSSTDPNEMYLSCSLFIKRIK